MLVMKMLAIHLKKVTRLAEHLGWKGKGSNFDILPLIYQLPNDTIKIHELPSDIVKEVSIHHEHYPKLSKLGLKWYAVPIISNMDLKSVVLLTYSTF